MTTIHVPFVYPFVFRLPFDYHSTTFHQPFNYFSIINQTSSPYCIDTKTYQNIPKQTKNSPSSVVVRNCEEYKFPGAHSLFFIYLSWDYRHAPPMPDHCHPVFHLFELGLQASTTKPVQQHVDTSIAASPLLRILL